MNIWVNGCFDIIHRGHIELFKYAKSFGNQLIVGTDTDNKIQILKGQNRPVNNQHDRKFILESIKYIDKVVFFDTDEELSRQVKIHNIDLMVTSTDHMNHYVPGSENSKYGVVFFPRLEHLSTTKTIQKCSEK